MPAAPEVQHLPLHARQEGRGATWMDHTHAVFDGVNLGPDMAMCVDEGRVKKIEPASQIDAERPAVSGVRRDADRWWARSLHALLFTD